MGIIRSLLLPISILCIPPAMASEFLVADLGRYCGTPCHYPGRQDPQDEKKPVQPTPSGPSKRSEDTDPKTPDAPPIEQQVFMRYLNGEGS